MTALRKDRKEKVRVNLAQYRKGKTLGERMRKKTERMTKRTALQKNKEKEMKQAVLQERKGNRRAAGAKRTKIKPERRMRNKKRRGICYIKCEQMIRINLFYSILFFSIAPFTRMRKEGE